MAKAADEIFRSFLRAEKEGAEKAKNVSYPLDFKTYIYEII